MTDETTPPLTGRVVEEGVAEPADGKPTKPGGVTRGDPDMVGGGPGGEDELAGADALGGSDADLGRGGD